MPLDDHILRNEQILASADSIAGGVLYATNQRVIRYQKGMFNEKVESLSYSHIVEASYHRQSPLGVLIDGILCIVDGLILFGILPPFLDFLRGLFGGARAKPDSARNAVKNNNCDLAIVK